MKIKLISEWKRLWRAWTMWAAGVGIVLPDLLNIVAENIDGVALLDAGHKSLIRLACLVAVVLLRPIQQPALKEEKKNETDAH